jgi:cell filamentation protein
VTEFVDPYFDAEHGCLRNRLGITDPDELGAREHAIVAVRQRQLDQQPGAPAATVDAWRAVHRHLFGDIYDWAGEFRTVNITKGTHTFHPASHLHIAADYCANAMSDIARLDRPNRDVLAERLSELLADMNEAHPFREGNGRTQRVIVGQLAAHHDHPIAWRAFSPIQNI